METEFHLYQNASQLNLTVIPMRNIGYTLDKLEKHYWLAGGTLLGSLNIYYFFRLIFFFIFKRLVSSLWNDTIYTRCRFWFICRRI